MAAVSVAASSPLLLLLLFLCCCCCLLLVCCCCCCWHQPRFTPNHGLHQPPFTPKHGLHQPRFTPTTACTNHGLRQLRSTPTTVYTKSRFTSNNGLHKQKACFRDPSCDCSLFVTPVGVGQSCICCCRCCCLLLPAARCLALNHGPGLCCQKVPSAASSPSFRHKLLPVDMIANLNTANCQEPGKLLLRECQVKSRLL